MVGERGHVAPGQDNTYLHRSWRADFELEEASFQDISALVYSLSSSDVATDFVNEAAIHVQRCLEARANAQGDVLVEPFDVTKFGLDPVLWRGVSSSAEIGWATTSRLAFFTPHGPDVYHVVFEFSEAAPTELGARRTRELLAQFDYAFSFDDLLPGEFSPDALAMVETAVLQAFGPEALGWDENDHRCIAEQMDGFERRNFVVEDVAMQWCVPQKLAADWAERLSIGRHSDRRSRQPTLLRRASHERSSRKQLRSCA